MSAVVLDTPVVAVCTMESEAVAPPDTEHPDMPPNLHLWRPIVRDRLPFASLVVASSNDPHCALDRARDMAHDWGSRWLDAGDRGHLNSASGLGDWPDGWALQASLLG